MMFPRIFPALSIVMALLVAGCHHQSAEPEEHGHLEVSFKPAQGLSIPPATAKFIGLETEEVSERVVKGSSKFTGQVFQTPKERSSESPTPETALATAFLNTNFVKTLHLDQAVKVADSTNQFEGRIVDIKAPTSEMAGETEVIVCIEDSQKGLRAGEFITIHAEAGGDKKVASIPVSAVIRTAEQFFVYTVSGDRFVRTEVKLGNSNADFVEVKDGLYSGDQIVTKPVMSLWMAELQAVRGGKACADDH